VVEQISGENWTGDDGTTGSNAQGKIKGLLDTLSKVPIIDGFFKAGSKLIDLLHRFGWIDKPAAGTKVGVLLGSLYTFDPETGSWSLLRDEDGNGRTAEEVTAIYHNGTELISRLSHLEQAGTLLIIGLASWAIHIERECVDKLNTLVASQPPTFKVSDEVNDTNGTMDFGTIISRHFVDDRSINKIAFFSNSS
jgi:hypothetical protein